MQTSTTLPCLMATALLLLVCHVLLANAENIDINRVHIVDVQAAAASSPTDGSDAAVLSYLVRGNAPLTTDAAGTTVFAYDLLLEYTRQRAETANYTTFPANNSQVYLIDISFENIFDGGYENEALFWSNASNDGKGRYLHWELLGAVVWATGFSASEQVHMIEDGTVWKEDQIPTRIQTIRSMLLTGPPAGYKALVIYVHCAGGCDRTGEFVGSYRMNYFHTTELKPIYAMDVSECGRAPDYFASGALGWFCLTWNLYNASALRLPPMTDCLTAYTCKLLGSCNATGL